MAISQYADCRPRCCQKHHQEREPMAAPSSPPVWGLLAWRRGEKGDSNYAATMAQCTSVNVTSEPLVRPLVANDRAVRLCRH